MKIMQKINETKRKCILMRIISLGCFIFALVASPSAVMIMNRMPHDNATDTYVGIYSGKKTEESDSDEIANRSEKTDITDNEIQSTDSSDNAIDESELIEQSETEVFQPTLSESYMLRELFSNVVFENDEEPTTGKVGTDKVESTAPSDGSAQQENPAKNEAPTSVSVTDNNPTETANNDIPAPQNTDVHTSDIGESNEAVNENSVEVSENNVTVIGNSKGRITTMRVLNHNTGAVSTLDLDEYLAQVIISEMPSYAGDEALKAQAVASRTFVINRVVNSPTHDNADVCTNPGHCQAFLEKNAFIAKYGNSGQHYYDRAYSAAKQTSGQIVTYNGSPITAAYHASSGGSTMASADVWGGNLPYLVSVYSPEKDDPEMLSIISSHKTYSKDEFIRRLVSAGYSAVGDYYDSSFGDFLGAAVQTPSGKVDYMTVAGEYVSGQKLKSIFSLRSTCFTVNYDADNITFVCLGYGHGVGMSQLGACTMAKQGSSYIDILTHYSTGVEVSVW